MPELKCKICQCNYCKKCNDCELRKKRCDKCLTSNSGSLYYVDYHNVTCVDFVPLKQPNDTIKQITDTIAESIKNICEISIKFSDLITALHKVEEALQELPPIEEELYEDTNQLFLSNTQLQK